MILCVGTNVINSTHNLCAAQHILHDDKMNCYLVAWNIDSYCDFKKKGPVSPQIFIYSLLTLTYDDAEYT